MANALTYALVAALLKPSPMAVICPFCYAPAGSPCVTTFGKARQAHAVRRMDA